MRLHFTTPYPPYVLLRVAGSCLRLLFAAIADVGLPACGIELPMIFREQSILDRKSYFADSLASNEQSRITPRKIGRKDQSPYESPFLEETRTVVHSASPLAR